MTQVIDLVKRNTRVAALIAVVVVLVVVTFIFYSGSQSAASEQEKLEKQVTTAKVNLTIAQGQYDVEKLQNTEQPLKAELAQFKDYSPFPATFPSVELSRYIAGAADRYRVALVSMSPRGAVGTEAVGGQQYVRNETGVQVSGGYEAMDSFLSYLEAAQAGQFPSLRLENASFTPTGGTFTVVILTRS